MEIKELKINGFGSLENRTINLKSGINVIYGKNESGKSTLHKFISSMFYGVSKNKNGKEISDYDRYKPWSNNDFSGKMVYELDNGEVIEVFRDFNKKNCKLYDKNGVEITDNYAIDKLKGNQFFIEQTGIPEEILMKTVVAEQTEMALNKDEQNVLLQKISNTLSTGNDNISLKKAMSKLKEKQMQEIGTDRTTERPINIVKKRLLELNRELSEIQCLKSQNDTYENEKQSIVEKIQDLQNQIEVLNEVKSMKERFLLEREKININNSALYEYKEKIDNIQKEKADYEEKFKFKKNNKFMYLSIIFLSISIILSIIIKNIYLLIPFFVITVIFFGISIYNNNIYKKKISEKNTRKMEMIKEIDILNNTLKQKENEIKEMEELYQNQFKDEVDKLSINYYQKINREYLMEYISKPLESIKADISYKEEMKGNLKIKLNTIEITYKSVIEKLEKLPDVEEKINKYKIQERELISLNNSINLAKDALDEAYEQMKENITPTFINNLSKIISSISNEKYLNAKFNDIDGLMVETSNGEYVNADKLSVGTIDQLYFSLRLSTMNEITKESIPLLLDEAFVYYDKDRLENILLLLEKNYEGKQIILFSCNEREKNILESKNICYNFIEL